MLKEYVKKILNLEILFLVACLIFFIMIFVDSYQLETVATYRLPRVLSGLGLAVTVAILIVKFNKIHARAQELKTARKSFEGINFFLTMLLSAVYFFIIQYLGFILTTAIAIFGFSLLMRYKNKKIGLGVAVFLSLIIYFIFVNLLKVHLPMGPIEQWLV